MKPGMSARDLMLIVVAGIISNVITSGVILVWFGMTKKAVMDRAYEEH
jgi:hypothetical protein